MIAKKYLILILKPPELQASLKEDVVAESGHLTGRRHDRHPDGSPEFTKDVRWLGLFTVNILVNNGLYMVITWLLHGYYMVIIWLLYG